MPGAPGSDHAAICYQLKKAYLVYGCPVVSSATGGWNDTHCVAYRQQMARAHCPVPDGKVDPGTINGLGATTTAGKFGFAAGIAATLGLLYLAIRRGMRDDDRVHWHERSGGRRGIAGARTPNVVYITTRSGDKVHGSSVPGNYARCGARGIPKTSVDPRMPLCEHCFPEGNDVPAFAPIAPAPHVRLTPEERIALAAERKAKAAGLKGRRPRR